MQQRGRNFSKRSSPLKKIIIKVIKMLFLKKAFKLSGRNCKSIKAYCKMRTTKTILKNTGLKKTFDKKKLTYNLHKRLDMGNTGIEHIRSREWKLKDKANSLPQNINNRIRKEIGPDPRTKSEETGKWPEKNYVKKIHHKLAKIYHNKNNKII